MVNISSQCRGVGRGRTMVQYSGVNAAFDNSVKDRQIVKNTRLAAFTASLQCTDEVKVVSRGTSRSQTSTKCGIWWLASAAENDGERGWNTEPPANVLTKIKVNSLTLYFSKVINTLRKSI